MLIFEGGRSLKRSHQRVNGHTLVETSIRNHFQNRWVLSRYPGLFFQFIAGRLGRADHASSKEDSALHVNIIICYRSQCKNLEMSNSATVFSYITSLLKNTINLLLK